MIYKFDVFCERLREKHGHDEHLRLHTDAEINFYIFLGISNDDTIFYGSAHSDQTYGSNMYDGDWPYWMILHTIDYKILVAKKKIVYGVIDFMKPDQSMFKEVYPPEPLLDRQLRPYIIYHEDL